MPLGTEKATLLGAGGGANANYFGDGSDGALTTSGNVTYTVANKVVRMMVICMLLIIHL
jgi:hypothetical protein